jgi:hypothetical protein
MFEISTEDDGALAALTSLEPTRTYFPVEEAATAPRDVTYFADVVGQGFHRALASPHDHQVADSGGNTWTSVDGASTA